MFQKPPMDFVQLFDMSSIPIQLVDCLHELLRYEPTARLTTLQCLAHAYFTDVAPRLIPPSLSGAGMLNARLMNGAPSPRSNGPYHPPSHLLTPNSGQQYMSVDLPSISPQIVPTTHNQGSFPKARPAHILTPSNGLNTADAVMSDPESSASTYSFPPVDTASSPSPYSHRGAVAYLPHPSAHVSHPDLHRRGSQPYETYSQHSYEYPPSITRDPSFLSLSPGFTSSHDNPPPEPSPTSHSSLNPSMSHQKSRSRTLASVFSSTQSLKRTPSDRAPIDPHTGASVIPIDLKKAKKEAEKAAKEEAKLESQAKREAARRSAQERSRAVLQKQRLAQGPDMLVHVNPEFGAPIGAPRKLVDKGKGRAALHPPMPQIVEDCSRVRNVHTHQLPRPSVASSRDTQQSDRPGYYDVERRPQYAEEDRRFSINSYNTMDSDPGPGPSRTLGLHRSPSLGSGCSRLSVASSPNLASLYRASTPASTASSLDHQLVVNMASLSANERDGSTQLPPANGNVAHSHWPTPTTSRPSEEALRRSRSPSDPRFSPYPVPVARPSLPSISNFDFASNGPPPPHPPFSGSKALTPNHERHLSVSSSAPSIASLVRGPGYPSSQHQPPPPPHHHNTYNEPPHIYEATQRREGDEEMDDGR